MGSISVEATRELCDSLDDLVAIAKESRAPIRALSLIERARADLRAYLAEIDRRLEAKMEPAETFLRKL